MSTTVYSRVQEFAKTVPHFKFHSAGINLIGKFIAREWRQQGGTNEQLDIVQSVEPSGTFMVFSYPVSFIPSMDEVISRYVKWCLSPKVKNEKPLIKANPSHPISYSSDTATPPKKRTRKPVQAPPKPEFSGKTLKR